MQQKLTQLKQLLGKYKKQLVALMVVGVIAGACLGVLHETIEVEGLVTNLTYNEVTVADFWGARSVTIDDSWLKDAKLKVGDQVDIIQNCQGRATDIRIGHAKNMGNMNDFDHPHDEHHSDKRHSF